jgi:undecaprenyl-diphosphatase
VRPPIKVSGVPLDSRAARRIKAGEGGPAERLAFRMQRIPALIVTWIVANIGALLLASVMICIGLFITNVLLPIDAVSRADDWLPKWLEGRRTPFWDDASYVASTLADRPVVIPLIAAVVLYLVMRKRWRMASFVVQAALAEVLMYGLVVYFVTRQRPPVEQLDPFNLRHSYPSGHVAASVAIYGALALLLAAHFKDIRVRVAIWTIAAAFPIVVAASRIYRGEHHPIDVVAGAFMGAGALCIALFAARTARRVAELRHEKHAEALAERAADAEASVAAEASAEATA